MTEQEQFDDTIKRLQDRLNAGGAEAPEPGTADMLPIEEDIQRRIKADERTVASVDKQLGELPARPGGADSRVLSFPAATLKAYASRRKSPAPTNLDVGPAMAALGPVGRTPENEADPMNLGVAPVPPPSDGDASDEPVPPKRHVIKPGDPEPVPEVVQAQLNMPEVRQGSGADMPEDTAPPDLSEFADKGLPPQAFAANIPPDETPVAAPEPAKPTENASPVAVAQAKQATPAVSVADTGGGDEDPEEAVMRYAANRAKGMSEILRIGNRFAAGIAGKKPDFGTADWLDKMEAGDEAAVKARADRAQKLREYAAQRADKERQFGLQERIPYPQTKEYADAKMKFDAEQGALSRGAAERVALANREAADKRSAMVQQGVRDRFETGIDKYRDQEIKELGTKVFAPIADVGTAIQTLEDIVPGITTGDTSKMPPNVAVWFAGAGPLGQGANTVAQSLGLMDPNKANELEQAMVNLRTLYGRIQSGLTLTEGERKALNEFFGMRTLSDPKRIAPAIQTILKSMRQKLRDTEATYGSKDPQLSRFSVLDQYKAQNPTAFSSDSPIFKGVDRKVGTKAKMKDGSVKTWTGTKWE